MEAREAHNLEVAGSIPAPATRKKHQHVWCFFFVRLSVSGRRCILWDICETHQDPGRKASAAVKGMSIWA